MMRDASIVVEPEVGGFSRYTLFIEENRKAPEKIIDDHQQKDRDGCFVIFVLARWVERPADSVLGDVETTR